MYTGTFVLLEKHNLWKIMGCQLRQELMLPLYGQETDLQDGDKATKFTCSLVLNTTDMTQEEELLIGIFASKSTQ